MRYNGCVRPARNDDSKEGKMLSLTMKKNDVNTRLVRRDPNYCLVVEFENSVPPMVWHLDLEKTPSFTLSLRGSGDDWALGIVEHKGEFTSIARFDSRDEASDAYAAVQKTIMKRPYRGGSKVGQWMLILLLMLVVYVIGSGFYEKWSENRQGGQMSQTQSGVSSVQQPQALRPGVPMSADDVLRGQ